MVCEKLHECKQKDCSCERKAECIVYRDRRRKAVCEEKGKRYELVNDKGCLVTLYHMDGGMIKNEEGIQKCDYLYTIDEKECPTAIFVELKGTDIPHAIAQLRASIGRYEEELKSRIFARIICKSVPRLYNDPSVRNLKKELRNKYQGGMVISEKNLEDIYSKLGQKVE